MTGPQQFSVDAARQAAERDELGAWVVAFLGSPGSDNAPLGELLSDPPRSWLGPVPLPLDRLHRLAGPPDQPVLCPVSEDEWREDVYEMRERIERGWEPPPVIVTWQRGQLVLEDGNHRVESLRQAGVDEAWAVIGFEDPSARDRFELPAR